MELLSGNRAPARLAAIEALSRALVGALAACLQPHPQVLVLPMVACDTGYQQQPN